MKEAKNKDQKESAKASSLSRFMHLPFKSPKTGTEDTSWKIVKFRLMTSITDTQPTLVPRERRLSDATLQPLGV